MDPRHRPLSPHLQIYQPQLTSILSILHRVAGVYLAFGIMALAFWIISLSTAEHCFVAMTSFYGSTFGQLLFASWVVAFFYHFANGIRHLVWDAGYGFDLSVVNKGGWAVLIFAVLASLCFFSFKIGS